MPWTPQGPYVPVGAFSSGNANNIEAMYAALALLFGPNFVAPFVLSGGACTIHGGNPKQLDVTTCVYFALQATDSVPNTLYQRTVTATSFLTVTPSVTYFLDYNPDGSTSWGTSHSGAANYLTIASVTTDGSGNIATITMNRQLNVNLFPSAIGVPQFAGNTLAIAGPHSAGQTIVSYGNGAPSALAANEVYFQLT